MSYVCVSPELFLFALRHMNHNCNTKGMYGGGKNVKISRGEGKNLASKDLHLPLSLCPEKGSVEEVFLTLSSPGSSVMTARCSQVVYYYMAESVLVDIRGGGLGQVR
jgi:hypothetical protein